MTDHYLAQVPDKIRQLHLAKDLALDWILAHIDADGRAVGAERFNGYYRLPWSLALAGRRDTAAKVLEWITDHALDDCGDWREGAARQPFMRSIAAYPHPQLVIGAWYLERYELAHRVMRVVRERFVDAPTGGAFSERPEVRHTGRTDLLCTAQVGLAALVIGDKPLAEGCYRWIARLHALQTEAPQRLYPCRIGDQLLTHSSADHSPWDVVTDFHRPRQQFYNPGIASAFLARYATAMDCPDALKLSHDFLNMNVQGAALQFDHRTNAQICKFGWGAAALMDVTDGTEQLGHVLRMADWFMASQHADGHWTPSLFLVSHPDAGDCMPKTAEHLLHVMSLLSALGRLAH
jgi:hypothetical protein